MWWGIETSLFAHPQNQLVPASVRDPAVAARFAQSHLCPTPACLDLPFLAAFLG